MYEARQNKEKVSRTLSFSKKIVMQKEKTNKVRGNIMQELNYINNKMHDKKCSCALCRGINREKLMPIQMCPKCMNPKCKHGEICGIGDDLEGLLPKTVTADKVIFYNQRMGHNGLPKEWEHPFPKAAMKKSGFEFYNSSPVYEVDKSVHRNAVDGGGNGVSSTGYSEIAQGWSKYMADTAKREGLCAGIRLGIIDNINALYANKDLRIDHVSTFLQLVRGYVQNEQITEEEAGCLSTEIYNFIYKLLDLQNSTPSNM